MVQDFEIWEHKQYADSPALAKEDGPIGVYRRYCEQFYPELRESTRSPPLAAVD